MAIRAGVLTISDKASRGERTDTSGIAIGELLATIDAAVQRSEVVPDEAPQIAETLRTWADSDELDLPRKTSNIAPSCLETGVTAKLR